MFYFRPGHETFPIFYQAEVQQQVMTNAVRWLAPVAGPYDDLRICAPKEPLEKLALDEE